MRVHGLRGSSSSPKRKLAAKSSLKKKAGEGKPGRELNPGDMEAGAPDTEAVRPQLLRAEIEVAPEGAPDLLKAPGVETRHEDQSEPGANQAQAEAMGVKEGKRFPGSHGSWRCVELRSGPLCLPVHQVPPALAVQLEKLAARTDSIDAAARSRHPRRGWRLSALLLRKARKSRKPASAAPLLHASEGVFFLEGSRLSFGACEKRHSSHLILFCHILQARRLQRS